MATKDETKIEATRVTINGVEYLRADQCSPQPPIVGNRHILVADRGWIFCGDLVRMEGRILLSRVVHVRSWSSIGFDGLIESGGRGSNVVVRKLTQPVDLPNDAELFAVPVPNDWGL
jgi:hypothetical protein